MPPPPLGELRPVGEISGREAPVYPRGDAMVRWWHWHVLVRRDSSTDERGQTDCQQDADDAHQLSTYNPPLATYRPISAPERDDAASSTCDARSRRAEHASATLRRER
jgi:hypothetical protein